MSTSLTYNGQTLQIIRVNSFQQETAYNDDRTEYLYTKYTIDCQCVFSVDTHGSPGAASLNAARLALLTPHKTLRITSGGALWLNVVGPDINVGPRPVSLNVTKVTGSRTFLCNYVIEAYKSDCESETEILSNRWSMAVSFDQDQMQTRTITGIIIRDPRIVTTNVFPFAMPILPKRWRRESYTFNISSDGTRVDYVIVDKEVNVVPPKPATQAKGKYRWGVSRFGTRATAEVDVTLRGNNSSSPVELVELAAAIVLSRINLQPANGAFKDYILNAAVVEDLFENEISMQVQVEKVNGLDKFQGFLIDANAIGRAIPGTEDNVAFDWTDLTNPAAALLVALLKSTVCEESKPTNTVISELEEEGEATTTETEITATVGDIESIGEAAISIEHKQNAYGEYDVKVDYETDEHSIQLPVAGPSPQDSVRIQTAAPITRKVVTFVARRYGALPVIPAFISSTDQGFLISKDIKTSDPKLLPNGEDFEFTIAGRYTYGMNRAIDESSYLLAPRSPETTRTLDDNAIRDVYRTDITGDGVGPGGTMSTL